MANHDSVLVPVETWAYASPSLRSTGSIIDIGLFAEALIYYDCVIVNPTNQPQFANFLQWFINQNRLDDFYALLQEGSLKIYDYAFMTTVIEKEGSYSLWNIQDQIQAKENTFEQRFLYHKEVESLFPKARHRNKLYTALRENVIEVKSEGFSDAIENAREDYKDPRRNAVVVQSFVDELYKYKRLGHPPIVEAKVVPSPDGSKHNLTWNVDFNVLSRLAGKEVNFHLGTPLTASAHSNRLIWSASNLGSDLYLPTPMSALVGDKLYESTQRISKLGKIIEDLKVEVEFPDIRELVNSGKMDIDNLLKIRKQAKKFRAWLQQESERDRNAIIAYHNEVARESGIKTGARKAVSIFGILGGGAAGSLAGSLIAGPVGGAVGGAAGSAVGYLADVTSKIGSNWKPVIFGDWLRKRIEDVVND